MTMPFLGTTQVGSFPSTGVRPLIKKHKIFTSSDIWLCPPNVYEVNLIMCGGGGGGGGGDGASTGGSGGAGAATLFGTNIDVTPGTTYTITVGAAGAGGTSGQNGTSGGTTSLVGGHISISVPGGGRGRSPGNTISTSGSVVSIPSTVVPFSVTGILGHNLFYVPGASGGTSGLAGSGSLFSVGGTAFGNNDLGGGGGASAIGVGGNAQVNAGQPGLSPASGFGGGGAGGGASSIGAAGASGSVKLVWMEHL